MPLWSDQQGWFAVMPSWEHSPTALRACLSSRVKAVSGTSSDTGMIATVERLLAGFPASHLLLELCSPRGWPVHRENTCHQSARLKKNGMSPSGRRESVTVSPSCSVSEKCNTNLHSTWEQSSHILHFKRMNIRFHHFWLLVEVRQCKNMPGIC